METEIEDVFVANLAPIGSLQETVNMYELLNAKDAKIAALSAREDELNALCLDYQIDVDAARQEIAALKQERDDYRVAARLAETKETAAHIALNEMRRERDTLRAQLEKADALADSMIRECESCETPCGDYVLARLYKESRHG